MNIEVILKTIAQRNNTTEAQVKCDLEEAIRLSYLSQTEKNSVLWKCISPDGSLPTIECFLEFCLYRLFQPIKK